MTVLETSTVLQDSVIIMDKLCDITHKYKIMKTYFFVQAKAKFKYSSFKDKIRKISQVKFEKKRVKLC